MKLNAKKVLTPQANEKIEMFNIEQYTESNNSKDSLKNTLLNFEEEK
jgi:hypothetical protein